MSSTARSLAGFTGFTRVSGHGRSETARKIDSTLIEVTGQQAKTACVQLGKYRTLRLLRDVAANCGESNWGGYEERAVSSEALDEAVRLLDALPAAFSSPDVTPEPSGAISYEWRFTARRILLLSVQGRGIVEYAGVMGQGTELHGRCAFAGDLPTVLFRLMIDVRGRA
jgi:hypothetical protein